MTIGQIATCAGFVALVGAMIVTSEQPAQALTALLEEAAD